MLKMARKKYKRKTKNTARIDVVAVATVVISLLLCVLLYAKSGYIGQLINDFFGGMMGIMRYVFPIGLFVVAIRVASSKEDSMSVKITQFALLLLCITVIMSVHQFNKGGLSLNNEVSTIIQNAYDMGSRDIGGGAFGTLAAIPLVKLFGNVGAMILAVGLSVIMFVITFGIDLSETISNLWEEILTRREERLQRREQEQAKLSEKIEETPRERRKRERQEKLLAKRREQEEQEEQVKINFNGRIIDNETKEGKNNQLDINNMLIEDEKNSTKVENNPDYIEGNLFKQEEEKKEDKTKEVLQLSHTLAIEDEVYEYPPITLLSVGKKKSIKGGAKALTETATQLQRTLHSFGVSAKVENVSVGPAITRYELKPAEGVRVSKIANLADDIALNLAAETIRIEAPIPGKQAVGIEVPNKEKEAVHLREVLESEEFLNNKSKLSVALGKDIAGQAVIADIAKMPHVLIAGSTGSGKSVCINTIITSIIYNAKPSEVKLVMVDPKIVELSVYNGIPHLLIPVVTDPRKAAGALAWAVQEMDNRYALFAEKGVRDLEGYNKAVEKDGETGKVPQMVIIVDELADLMMVAAKDVEEAICRLAQKARAAGMHLVIATQRPSVDVITGLIKANVPSRIAFAVSSQVDSRTILDSIGAEKLLGKGDMLFYPAGAPKPSRVQGAFVTDAEVEKIVDFVKSNSTATYNEDILESIENSNKTDKEIAAESEDDDDTDELLMEAIDLVVTTGQASTTFIQRKLKVGYARAGRIVDQMEERGVISGYQGSKPRQVLMSLEKLQELKAGNTEDIKA